MVLAVRLVASKLDQMSGQGLPIVTAVSDSGDRPKALVGSHTPSALIWFLGRGWGG